MRKTRIVVILAVLAGTWAFGAEKPLPIIDEGFLLDGTEGLLKKDLKTDTWQFTPDEPIEISEKVIYPAQKPLELLPCSVLEQMAALAGEENELRVELSALFTQYKRRNYLFSVFFLPIQNDQAPPEPVPEPDTSESEKASPETEEPDSIIPANILKQIKANKAPDLKKFQQIAQVTGDVNLIGRAGFLLKSESQYNFSLDAFGRNIDNKQFVLLPCSMLERAERQMAREPGRERYNVSGLVTEYKGKTYMLLRRSSRTYTHGNFTP